MTRPQRNAAVGFSRPLNLKDYLVSLFWYGEQDFTHQSIPSVTWQPRARRSTQIKRLERCGKHRFSADLVSRPFAFVVKPKQARSQVAEKLWVEADTVQSRQLVHGCKRP